MNISLTDISPWFAPTIALISTTIAVWKAKRLKDVEHLRDTHLMRLWRKSKTLSSKIYQLHYKLQEMEFLFDRSRDVERDIAALIVHVGNLDRESVEKWYKSGEDELDEVDLFFLRECTRKIPSPSSLKRKKTPKSISKEGS